MQIGQKVTYITFAGCKPGIVKGPCVSDKNHVFVVYNCNNNWDKYYDYTAAKTRICDLILGWTDEYLNDLDGMKM